MSSWKGQMRAAAAYQRRLERDAIKRQRELEKLAKDRAKLDAAAQARLEVDEFENAIELLLSVHKDCAAPTNWLTAVAELPPPPPIRSSHHEMRARQAVALLPLTEKHGANEKVENARLRDDEVYAAALKDHSEAQTLWEKQVSLAHKIRAGDAKAYSEAVNELSPLGEITHLGSSTEFIVHTSRFMECNLGLSSSKIIPAEMKSLTAGGKVSIRAMPISRFHEIYQDYLCSCMLRVARELFALLPINTLLITATAPLLDSRTGHIEEQPVLSVALTRTGLAELNFEQIDPSDTIDSFTHRGEFKASRKSGAFLPIIPLTAADILPSLPDSIALTELIKRARVLRQEIAAELAAVRGQPLPSP